MPAGEGGVKAIVSVYRDESDTVFLGLSCDLHTYKIYLYKPRVALFGSNFAWQPFFRYRDCWVPLFVLLPTQDFINVVVGLLAYLVKRCTGIAEVKGSNPVQAWIFFGLFFKQLQKLRI